MKKISLFSLAIAVIIGGCTGNKPVEKAVLGIGSDYYLYPITLKGKVKEMKELNYWAAEKDGKLTRGDLMMKKDLDSVGSTPNLIAYFDDSGMLTKYEQLNGEKVIATNILTVENAKWKRIDFKMKDSTTSYFIPQYDNSGYFAGGSSYRPGVDTLTGKIAISNDSKGNYTRVEYYDNKNQRTGYHVFTIDEKGNYVESKYYNKSDSLTSTLTNTYDENGELIKQQTITEKPKSTSIWEYKDLKSDGHGNLVQFYADVESGKYKLFTERTFTYY